MNMRRKLALALGGISRFSYNIPAGDLLPYGHGNICVETVNAAYMTVSMINGNANAPESVLPYV